MSKSSEWTQNDAVELRNHLAKQPKFMRVLASKLPRNKDAMTIEAAAVTGMQMEGFLLALNAISAMCEDQTPSANAEQHGSIQ
jgi:CDP-diacylglycerol pyrophosphatase